MLGKLLKYELPAMGRKMLPLYAAWAVTAFMLGFSVDLAGSQTDFPFIISGILYTAVATAIMVITIIMIVQRYSNSLLGNDGYFYHVLPVGTSAHIGTKLISATMWVLATMVVAILTGVLIVAGVILAEGITLSEVMEAIRRFMEIDFNFPEHMALYVTEALILMLASIVKTVMQIYAALTIGYQAANHTTLASIAAYILLLVFESTVGEIVEPVTSNMVYGTDGFLDFHEIFVPCLAISVLLSALYFLICKLLLDKRLNLA